jgi:hypothetical protein
MAYFNHAFGKAFYAKTWNQTTTETSADLGGGGALGEFAFINAKYGVLDLAGLAGEEGGFYLAQSSFQTSDTIGANPGHGGYSESHKSKMIMKKYISKMWITDYVDETPAVYSLQLGPITGSQVASGTTVPANASATSCWPCGSDPIMRIDIKGTAALRLLNHNAYASLSGSLPMPRAGATVPTNGVDMCCMPQGTTTLAGVNGVTYAGIAPSIVAMNWKDQINNDPILSKFCTAELWVSRTTGNLGSGAADNATYEQVTDGSVNETAIYAGGARGVHQTSAAAATVVLAAIAEGSEGTTVGTWSMNNYRVVIKLKTSCELQTQFSSCSFDTRDFYLLGGLKVEADMQDEAGVPCVACQGYVTEGTTGTAGSISADFKQRNISSDTVINSVLLTENYRQSPYNQGLRDSSRFRTQEGMAGIITELGRDATDSACNGAFVGYHLIHNVPRFNNPTGVFDNDQYHYSVYVKRGSATLLEAAWVQLAIDAKIQKRDASGTVAVAQDLKDLGGEY